LTEHRDPGAPIEDARQQPVGGHRAMVPSGPRYAGCVALRFVIVGGGPAGHTAATHAARLGATVTLIERDIVGGAAQLWDCIPSKAMIATGGAMSLSRRAQGMGLTSMETTLDFEALRDRNAMIEGKLNRNAVELLRSQGVRMLRGVGRLVGPGTVEVDTADGTETIEGDAFLISTGSRPRVPDW